jgi:Ca-activated chloride channel family protein
MVLFAAASGLTGLLEDLREFVGGVRFARMDVLLLLLLLPLLGLLDRWAAARRRATILQLGRPSAIAAQQTQPVVKRRWLGMAYPIGWVLLVVATAGPRWGKSEETGVAVGRDVIILIDLSRSMRADDVSVPPGGWQYTSAGEKFDPRRWRAAREGAFDLLDGIAQRGGNRVGVVVFAAHSKLLCPLTTDYDHVRAVIETIDGQYPPPECRPGATEVISGTRIGAAIIEGVQSQDERFSGFQDIFLLSDGDDPGDDREWVRGADLARARGIPVFTVGIGNPDAATPLFLGDELVSTQLQEDTLERIAAETRGQYIAARTKPPRLGEFFRTHLESLPGREVSDESLPLPKERYRWFVLPAMVLFLAGWLRGR